MDEEQIYTAYLKGSLKLSVNGDWFHNGAPFTNRKVSEFLHRHIQWSEADQQYYVAYGKGRAEFDCEGTAFFVLNLLDQSGASLQIRLADQSIEKLDFSSLCIDAENRLYCRVKGGHKALFRKAAYQQFVEYLSSENSVNYNGQEFKIEKC